MITQEQLQLWRELTGRLSYFGLEGMAQDAITALLAERDALAAELATAKTRLAEIYGLQELA